MNNQTKTEREGTFGSSVLVLALAIAVLLTGVVGFKLDPHIPLLFSSSIILLYGVWLRVPWKDMRDSIIKSISESIEAILIICLIGMTVGSWISSGTVPMVIYYGLKIFSPQFFLISVLVLCSIMSIMTGSSWTTIGTIGVAFMGVGYGLGIPMGITAGAIICGAFFGDKQSPLSDSTNFAAAVAKTDLYDHVRSMIYTTGPAWLVSAVFFLFVGFSYSGGTADASQVDVITEGLAGAFNLNPVLLIPPVLLVVLIIKKFPAIPTMIIAAMMGMVLTVTVQGASLPDALRYMHSGFVGDTGVAAVDQLLTRGGLNSMTGTITLMLLSLTLAGALERTGVMHQLMKKAGAITGKRFGLIATTLVSSFSLSYFAADPYLAMLLPANALGEKYDEMGIDRRVLSRTLEDGGTVVCPMVPWGTSGIYCAATLGIPVLEYLPYYIMGFATPVFSLILAATGLGIFYTTKKIRKRARNVNTMNEKLAALGRPDSSFLAEAKAEAKALTVGRTEFLKATGWRSEPAYKKAMAASGQFMYHYHLCCESNEDFRRQMDRFDELLEEKNLHLDRFGVSIDPSMALPRDIRAENRQGGSLYFESQADWDMLGMSRRMQPHLGDNMLGSPASVETVSCALKAGVTTIGNLSQFFGWDYPQFPDTAARAKATASAMAIMAEHAADGALIHSNLDDGYGDKAPDMGLLAGCALLEKYIADLLGAKLAHSFGDMFHSPYKRLVFLSALCRIHPEGMTGSMIFANKLGRSHTDIELNTAHMTTCLLYDMAGQRVYRTGHAVTTLANQGLTTDTTPEQVVRTLEYAREMEAYVPAVIETIDFAKVDRDADMLVARGKRFVEATLEYLANYIDVTDPYAMLLAVKTAGVGNLTAAFADRDGRSAVPTDYCLMHE